MKAGLAAVLLACAAAAAAMARPSATYDDLVALFIEWRAFQKPTLVSGVPDYSAASMAAQHKALPAFQRRLAAIDASSWPVPQQIDWHILRAEMNGLDFDHRVLRPWANNPAFYVAVFPEPERSAGARGALRAGRRGDLELYVSALRCR